MTSFRPSSWFALLLGCIALLAAPARVGAQSGVNERFAYGTESLRWLMKNAKLDPVSRPESLKSDPEHIVLIVLGDLKWLESNVPGGVEDFVMRGGALLAASDRQSVEALENLAGVRIVVSHRVVVPLAKDDRNRHRGEADDPFVDATPAELPGGSENPFAGLQPRVATNVPRYLQKLGDLPDGIVPLARFPDGVYHFPSLGSTVNPSEIGELFRNEITFAVGGSRGEGRVLVMADHSVFINEMMLDDQCGNLEFTNRCLEWLKSTNQRNRAMLVEDGHIYPNFDVTLKRIPPIPPLKLLEELFNHRDEIADEMQTKIAEAERRDTVNSTALKYLDSRPPAARNRLRRYSLWGFGGFLAAAVLYRLSNNGRHFPDRHLPLLGPVVEKQKPAAAVAELRPRAQIDAGNLWESARELAQGSLGQNPLEDKPPPRPIVVADGWWQRRKAQRRIQRLWEIAYGAEPIPVLPARWQRFIADLENFENDVADGTVKLPAV
jgi:hypothetical protein